MFSSRRKVFLFVFLLFTIFPLVIILLPGGWQRCKASGKMILASVSVENGKLNRDTDIFYPQLKVVDDMNPPIQMMMGLIAFMPYQDQKSFFQDLKLIDRDLVNISPMQITSNISVSPIDETNIIEISYYGSQSNISEAILNLLMTKTIEFDLEAYEDEIKRNKNRISEIPTMLEKAKINASNKPSKKIQQEIENVKRYQQQVQKQQIYLEAVKEYLAQTSAETRKKSSVNYEIVEFANSSCSLMGHLNLTSIYLYWHSRWVYFRYS